MGTVILDEFGYDKVSHTYGTKQQIMDNLDKINPYEIVLSTDTDELYYKDNMDIVRNVMDYSKAMVEDTIDTLKSNGKYKIGDVIEVLGYYNKGDGANHKRTIASIDDGSGVVLASGLFANILYADDINVSWFGAKGDGITDDTYPIQKAFNLMKKYTLVDSKNTSNPKVSFLSKKYLVTNTIDCGAYVYIEGNNALIINNTENWTFGSLDPASIQCWQGSVSNLKIKANKGAKFNSRQGADAPKNSDYGVSLFSNCKFMCSYAFEMDLQSCNVKFESCYIEGHVSYICDNIVFDNCRMDTKHSKFPDKRSQFYFLGSKCYINNSMFIPYEGNKDPALELSFIYCKPKVQEGHQKGMMLVCENVNFGGESSGISAVYNDTKFLKYGSDQSSMISMKRCSLGGTVPLIINNEIPNLIDIENCRSTVTKGLIVGLTSDFKNNISDKIDEVVSALQNATQIKIYSNKNSMSVWESTPTMDASVTDKEIEFLTFSEPDVLNRIFTIDFSKESYFRNTYLKSSFQSGFRLPWFLMSSNTNYNTGVIGLALMKMIDLTIIVRNKNTGTYNAYSDNIYEYKIIKTMSKTATNQSIRTIEKFSFKSNDQNSTRGAVLGGNISKTYNGIENIYPIDLIPGDGYGKVNYVEFELDGAITDSELVINIVDDIRQGKANVLNINL